MSRIALASMLVLLPLRAQAADARELFVAGSKALNEGKPAEALQSFEAAYAAQPAPSLLFYLGEAHRALGHRAQAEENYAKYIKALPSGPKAADAKARYAELRAQAATDEAKAAPKKTSKKLSKKQKSSKKPVEAVALDTAPKAQPPPVSPPPPPAPVNPAPVAAAVVAPPAVVAAATPPPAPAPAPVQTASPAPALASKSAPPAGPQPGAPQNPTAVTSPPDALHTTSYTGRLVIVNGSVMKRYASALVGDGSALYTHGISYGRQSETFKNAVYVGFGTEWGGGTDTLKRYELSWQFAWAPLGTSSIFNPHLGFRLGGMMANSEAVTGGSLKAGLVVAPEAGVDLQLGRHFLVTVGVGYDANLGPALAPNSSLSGYALNLGGTLRF